MQHQALARTGTSVNLTRTAKMLVVYWHAHIEMRRASRRNFELESNPSLCVAGLSVRRRKHRASVKPVAPGRQRSVAARNLFDEKFHQIFIIRTPAMKSRKA